MPILDFTEIPQANTGKGDQDTFEFFARDFLTEILNFEIISEPNRGADGGKDIIAVEHQSGSLSSSNVVWLISCKHYAHSGKSVNESDEQNISDRLRQHSANGFLGFYSTLPSSGLNNRLDSYRKDFKISILDNGRIEQLLLAKKNSIIKRYFPKSYSKLSNKKPSIIFNNYEPLICAHCGKDVLLNKIPANIVFIENYSTSETIDVYVCCKNKCDDILLNTKRPEGFIDKWEDLNDLRIPHIFMKNIMALINNLYSGDEKYTQEALEKYKIIILRLSQFVLREQTDEEKRRVLNLSVFPTL